MENSMAKDVITQMYAEFKLYHHYTVENWGILCSALGCAVEALEKQIPEKPIKAKEHIMYSMCYICPNCQKNFGGTGIASYCYHCGQKLDWSDEK